ncbi:kinase-like domain-containing protein [Glomus cerebriforme]|uniref:Kinase-like domain-containing protein n=1 Tax=Glomus cerebriforme TaxID=658196 RepID=A0A397T1N0_9GLOM|nr:kinase-like domain-containing protein [Glomus cerebriforme]
MALRAGKNNFIDKFIQEAQLGAKNSYEVLEWIPYNRLKNINYYDKGGFSEIYKAIWLDGPIDNWNFDKQQWDRWNPKLWKYHYNCQKQIFSKFIQIFGITQDPYTLNYMIVMSYAKEGSLRKCLFNIVKLKWQYKLQLLKNIILGLKIIHESELVHCDLHDDSINRHYGVLPYMAPEVLRNKPYTSAGDIYSFSMIMWEFTSGVPPFNNRAHDHQLSLSICKGERPEIIENTPKCYTDLMEKCWDTDSSKRPTIINLENIISQWLRCVNEHYNLNNENDNITTDRNTDNQSIKNWDDNTTIHVTTRNQQLKLLKAKEIIENENLMRRNEEKAKNGKNNLRQSI